MWLEDRGERPRHYAARILLLPAAQRRRAMQTVPEEWRAWVQHYLDDWIDRFGLTLARSYVNNDKEY